MPVDAIVPNPQQPRQVFDEEALEELKTSIREVGVLQPIVVRQLGGDRYELVMGERRWRAAQALGRDAIPAIVRDTADDDAAAGRAAGEHPPSQAEPTGRGGGVPAAARGVRRRPTRSWPGGSGAVRPQISNTIRLLNLPPAVQRRVAAGVLSAGHARALLALEDPEAQEALAQRIVAEGMSVRATEEAVALALADERAGQAAGRSGGRSPTPRPWRNWRSGCRTGSTPG